MTVSTPSAACFVCASSRKVSVFIAIETLLDSAVPVVHLPYKLHLPFFPGRLCFATASTVGVWTVNTSTIGINQAGETNALGLFERRRQR